jgi:hypothetical protein
VLGLFRMLVSLQQLYQRHVLGKTTERRYLKMPPAVRGMAAAGVAVMENGRRSRRPREDERTMNPLDGGRP